MHQLHRFAPARSVLDLVGRVGLQQKHAAGLERGEHLAVQPLADGGWQGAEDGDDGVPGVYAQLKIGQVGAHQIYRYSLGVGQGLGFVQAHLRSIDGGDCVALLGQEHRVAPFAFGQAQDAALGQVREVGG